jgi:hypothetical protein
MSDSWKPVPVREVKVGDVVRVHTGQAIVVSRIEEAFFGMPTMLAFIQDTADGWFKAPQSVDAEIDVKVS